MMFGVKANGGSNPSTTASEPAGCLALMRTPGGFLVQSVLRGSLGGHGVSTPAFVMRCIKRLEYTTSLDLLIT